MHLRIAASFSIALLALACGSPKDDAPSDPSDAGIPETSEEDTLPEVAADAPPNEASVDVVEDVLEDGNHTFERTTYSGPEGVRDYLVYHPSQAKGEALPVVVVLHGCGQSAEVFLKLTRFHELAESESFIAVFPEQSGSANPMYCWNWFLEQHQQRDVGEAAILAGIVDQVTSGGEVDLSRVYAVGLSAGGAMAVVLGAVFPEKFAAVGSVEGCPFRGTPCLNEPSPLSADQLATLAHTAMGEHARALPVFVVQGDADINVPPANGDLLVGQWLGVADIVDNGHLDQSISRDPASVTLETAPGGKTYDVLSYVGATGEPLVLRWTVHGLSHAWPGGSASMSFSDPTGPDAAKGAWEFFSSQNLP